MVLVGVADGVNKFVGDGVCVYRSVGVRVAVKVGVMVEVLGAVGSVMAGRTAVAVKLCGAVKRRAKVEEITDKDNDSDTSA